MRSRSRSRAAHDAEATAVMAELLRDVLRASAAQRNFRVFGPDETASNRLTHVFEATNRAWDAETLSVRRSPVAGRQGHGDTLRAHLPGLARRLSADRAARLLLLLRGLHPHRRFDVQPARQMAEDLPAHSVAAADRLAQLPAHLPCLAPGPQRLQPPGSGLHRLRLQQEVRDRPRLSAARRQHAAVRDRPLPAQPQPHQRHRGRQAAGAAMARHGRGDRRTAPPASASGNGRATTAAANPTW